MILMKPAEKNRMFWNLFKGQVLSYFQHHRRRWLEAEDSELPDDKIMELVPRDIGLEYIPKHVIRMQKYNII
jgi:hypothetical protein